MGLERLLCLRVFESVTGLNGDATNITRKIHPAFRIRFEGEPKTWKRGKKGRAKSRRRSGAGGTKRSGRGGAGRSQTI